MNAKPPKPGMEETESKYKPDDDVEFTDAYLDTWFERNADALNATIRKAREGKSSTVEEVMARVMANIDRVAKKD